MSQTTAGRACTTVMYVAESPCCRRPVLVEGWELEFFRHNNNGVVQLRCGTVLDTPGWRRRGDHRQGCGALFSRYVSQVKIRDSNGSGRWRGEQDRTNSGKSVGK